MDYLIVYLEIIIFTLVMAVVLLINVRSEMGNTRDVNIFKAFLVTLILAMIADAFTQAQYRGFMHMSQGMVAFLYAFYMFMFSGVLPYLWFIFVETRLDTGLLKNRTAVAVSLIPLIIMSVMCFASIGTGWLFRVDSFGVYTRGEYATFQVVVTYFYFIFATVHALMMASKEKSSIKRREYYVLATFLIAPFIGSLLQSYIGQHPFVAPCTAMAMLFIFINIQGGLIHNDYLTGLFNRKSAEKYMEELKDHASKESPFHIFKMGVAGFQDINSAQDYTEGDRALQIVAGVLQRVTHEYNGYASRLGGAEFLSVIDGGSSTIKEDFEKSVSEALAAETAGMDLPYELRLDFGYACCDAADINIGTLMNTADKEMHKSKGRSRKAAAQA